MLIRSVQKLSRAFFILIFNLSSALCECSLNCSPFVIRNTVQWTSEITASLRLSPTVLEKDRGSFSIFRWSLVAKNVHKYHSYNEHFRFEHNVPARKLRIIAYGAESSWNSSILHQRLASMSSNHLRINCQHFRLFSSLQTAFCKAHNSILHRKPLYSWYFHYSNKHACVVDFYVVCPRVSDLLPRGNFCVDLDSLRYFMWDSLDSEFDIYQCGSIHRGVQAVCVHRLYDNKKGVASHWRNMALLFDSCFVTQTTKRVQRRR